MSGTVILQSDSLKLLSRHPVQSLIYSIKKTTFCFINTGLNVLLFQKYPFSMNISSSIFFKVKRTEKGKYMTRVHKQFPEKEPARQPMANIFQLRYSDLHGFHWESQQCFQYLKLMIVIFVSHLLLHYTIIIFKISPDIDLLGTKFLFVFILVSLL